MVLSVRSMNLVGVWQWNCELRDCGICQRGLEQTCPGCMHHGPGDACKVIKSTCGHAFHEHCIQKWLATLHQQAMDMELEGLDGLDQENKHHPHCPMCRQSWKGEELDD